MSSYLKKLKLKTYFGSKPEIFKLFPLSIGPKSYICAADAFSFDDLENENIIHRRPSPWD